MIAITKGMKNSSEFRPFTIQLKLCVFFCAKKERKKAKQIYFHFHFLHSYYTRLSNKQTKNSNKEIK